MNNSSEPCILDDEPCILDDEPKILSRNFWAENVSRNVSRETLKSLFFVLLFIHVYYITPIISFYPLTATSLLLIIFPKFTPA